MKFLSKKIVLIFFLITQTAISLLAQEGKPSGKKQKSGGDHCIS